MQLANVKSKKYQELKFTFDASSQGAPESKSQNHVAVKSKGLHLTDITRHFAGLIFVY
jgi:hypothetical protein